ncbi:MAG: desulfoferrodoxin [Patescibacteria group bacterium]|nr:desulfoferrodoxin [Patescibacteria group bacterium]
MTKLNEIYKCNVCGNMVELTHEGKGELVCCGQPMELLIAKVKEEGTEKHRPIIKTDKKGILVQVGSNPHPMAPKHHIEWIEVMDKKDVCHKYLKIGQKPQTFFNAEKIKIARAYCNIHGLWKN